MLFVYIVSFFILAISFMYQTYYCFLSVKFILQNKASEYQNLVFAKELILCSHLTSSWNIPFLTRGPGKQTYVIPTPHYWGNGEPEKVWNRRLSYPIYLALKLARASLVTIHYSPVIEWDLVWVALLYFDLLTHITLDTCPVACVLLSECSTSPRLSLEQTVPYNNQLPVIKLNEPQ